jgi:hypothetical protein
MRMRIRVGGLCSLLLCVMLRVLFSNVCVLLIILATNLQNDSKTLKALLKISKIQMSHHIPVFYRISSRQLNK